jgi:hypothetical protein
MTQGAATPRQRAAGVAAVTTVRSASGHSLRVVRTGIEATVLLLGGTVAPAPTAAASADALLADLQDEARRGLPLAGLKYRVVVTATVPVPGADHAP